MSKVKLLKDYRLTKDWCHSKDLPTGGVWQTVSVDKLNTENPIYKLVCVYPTHPKRKYLDEMTIPRAWIIDLMEEVEIKIETVNN